MTFIRYKETVDNYLWHREVLKCDVQYLRDKPYEISLTSSSSRVTNDSRKCSKCLPRTSTHFTVTTLRTRFSIDCVHSCSVS